MTKITSRLACVVAAAGLMFLTGCANQAQVQPEPNKIGGEVETPLVPVYPGLQGGAFVGGSLKTPADNPTGVEFRAYVGVKGRAN